MKWLRTFSSNALKQQPQNKASLPRPVVFGLLLSISTVIAPHAEHLAIWITSACGILLLWRAYLAFGNKPLPRRWHLLLITLVGTAGIILSFHTLLGRDASVALLVLLATLKFMELRDTRDAIVLIYLAFFIIITNFFYSQSVSTAVYVLATLIVIMTTWVRLQTEGNLIRASLRVAGTLLLQAFPLTLILFILFPRVQGPLWGMPQDAYANSGLDDHMAPGSLSRLSLSEDIAFRVSYNGRVPPPTQTYWRGPVLWYFDGLTWTPGKGTNHSAPEFTDLAQPVDYVVTLEPHNKAWLFTLDVPYKLSVPSTLSPDFQELSTGPVRARMRYATRSYLMYHANLHESDQQIRRALQLPPHVDPRARRLAQGWRTTNDDDAAIVRTALAYFSKQGFTYTLEPPALGPDSVDDFLFSTKKGFCEHYASAFVFLMRAANIPARVVTGYLGGEFNDVGNYYIVRQADAHAWAEVWFTGHGWVRVDPTGAIAPARVEKGLSAALSDSTALPFMERNPPQWMRDLRFNLDWMANQWNQWVLGYDAERQFAFLTRLGMESVTWQKMALDMMGSISIAILAIALFMLRSLFNARADRVQAAWLRVCARLAKRGLPRSAHEGPQNYAARVATARPELADRFGKLAAAYMAARYGNHNDETKKSEFLRLAKSLKI